MTELQGKNPGGPRIGAILHVVVVGFHHKKGSQVEYSYPPLVEGSEVDSGKVPALWRHLPSLAIPEGSHNFENDTIYFHLPSQDDSQKTLYCVSCCRQIDSDSLVAGKEEVTRNTVLKSVCIISALPLYGLIQAQTELITAAYFATGDFSRVELLHDTFAQLNRSVDTSRLTPTELFLDLSVRELILTFKHKVLVLFKLLLLERRIVVFHSPVKPLCSIILTLISLFPGMLESGLQQCCAVDSCPEISPTLHVARAESGDSDFLRVAYRGEEDEDDTKESAVDQIEEINKHNDSIADSDKPEDSAREEQGSNGGDLSLDSEDIGWQDSSKLQLNLDTPNSNAEPGASSEANGEQRRTSKVFEGQLNSLKQNVTKFWQDLTKTPSDISYEESLGSWSTDSWLSSDRCMMQLQPVPSPWPVDERGMPLAIFTKANFCQPYLALGSSDLLEDINTRAFVIGATNPLFRQKKQCTDVLVELSSSDPSLQYNDPELKKQVSLTSNDLRFADSLVKAIQRDSTPFAEGTGWEGGDEWLRQQFATYLCSLLSASVYGDEKSRADFGNSFLRAWRLTNNWRVWASGRIISPAPQLTPTATPDKATDQTVASDKQASVDKPDETEKMDEQRKPRDTKLSTKSSEDERSEDDRTPEEAPFPILRPPTDPPIHPCHGSIGLDDIKLKVATTLDGSERGRKINAAVQNTGKLMTDTGKAVGASLTQAKSAVSSWWSNLTDKKNNRPL